MLVRSWGIVSDGQCSQSFMRSSIFDFKMINRSMRFMISQSLNLRFRTGYSMIECLFLLVFIRSKFFNFQSFFGYIIYLDTIEEFPLNIQFSIDSLLEYLSFHGCLFDTSHLSNSFSQNLLVLLFYSKFVVFFLFLLVLQELKFHTNIGI